MGSGYRRTARLVIVPGREIRSQHFMEKGDEFVTIHTGRYQVVADVDDQDKIHVTRDLFDRMFVVEAPALPAGQLAAALEDKAETDRLLADKPDTYASLGLPEPYEHPDPLAAELDETGALVPSGRHHAAEEIAAELAGPISQGGVPWRDPI